jgi:hypothetical protein
MPRQRVTNAQRQALRSWVFAQATKPSHKACIAWFESQFNHRISQSTVSESLGDHFKHLDRSTPPSHGARQRVAQWPILEAILWDWQKTLQEKRIQTSGELLRLKASEIWYQIPQYKDLEPPEFSQGWLSRFKQRHGIKQHTQHGEAGSVPAEVEVEMRSIRTLCGEYQEEDIYNMDETGLYWRSTFSTGLSSEPTPGRKKDKSRISVVLCTNCTGTDRVPPWFLGHAKQPRALRGINVTALGGYWRGNKKAWMTTAVMTEWLGLFYSHIGSRTVILCMDNLKTHIKGVETAPPPSNIRIIWLPKNSTSIFQPLDQGIIQNFKVHYRRQWLAFIITELDHNRDPFSCVTVYNAVRWSLSAWKYSITNTTIYNCFRKSSIIQPRIENLPSEPPPDVAQLFAEAQRKVAEQEVQRTGRILESMSLYNFLNPVDEDLAIGEETTLEDIIEHHTGQYFDNEDAILEDVEPPPEAIPSLAEAIGAVQTLLQYQVHQEQAKMEEIRFLERFERGLSLAVTSQRAQSTLDGWIT